MLRAVFLPLSNLARRRYPRNGMLLPTKLHFADRARGSRWLCWEVHRWSGPECAVLFHRLRGVRRDPFRRPHTVLTLSSHPQDIGSIMLNALANLLEKYKIPAESVGRLEVCASRRGYAAAVARLLLCAFRLALKRSSTSPSRSRRPSWRASRPPLPVTPSAIACPSRSAACIGPFVWHQQRRRGRDQHQRLLWRHCRAP